MSAALSPDRLKQAEHYFTNYAVVLPHGMSLEDVAKPEFWAHCQNLRQHDTIRIIPEDGSYFAELLVLSAGRGFAKTKLLRHVEIDEAGTEDAGNELVEVKWRGPHSKWSIVRRSDGHVLKEGLTAKGDALREAASYSKLAA